MLIGAEGTRLLREKRGQGRPRRSISDEEAPGPPAESEWLQRKSTPILERDFFSALHFAYLFFPLDQREKVNRLSQKLTLFDTSLEV